MREIALLLAGSFAMFMTWRGYRRGALAMVAGCVPSFLTLLTLIFILWREPEQLSTTLTTAGVAGAAVFIGATLALRTLRSRQSHRTGPDATGRESRRWSWWCNHITGAGLGLLWSATFCIGLACLGSMLPFIHSLRAQVHIEEDQPEETPLWITSLGEACRSVADASESAVLEHIPRLREYGAEVRSVITILNAPPDDLKRVAKEHGILELETVPAVQTALEDKEYAALFLQLKDGDVSVVPELLDSAITHDLISCPEIRELTETLTPSVLADDLSSTETKSAADLR